MKFNKKKFIWLSLLVVVLLAELFFDLFEITVGNYLLLTNSLRPRIGRLWQEEQKDILAQQEVTEVETTTPDSLYSAVIVDYENLLKILAAQSVVYLDKENFMALYKRVDGEIARLIADPFAIYDLDRGTEWHLVKIAKTASQINFAFLDGFGRLIKETFMNGASQISKSAVEASALNRDPLFSGRIVSAEDFLRGFDLLPRSFRLQVINNPFRLIQIKDNLARVAISREAKNGSVTIAFELHMGATVQIQKMEAAEMAVGYLIAAIAESGGPQISAPQSGGNLNE